MTASQLRDLVNTQREGSTVQSAIILIRVLVGPVFITEGIQKFLFSESLGVGRFMKIGIPAPEFFAPFVGVIEILCGTMLLLGVFTSLAALPLIISMSVAVWTTKVPMLMEKGFWAAAHEARTDWSMILGLTFLLIAGGGRWSVDRWRRERAEKKRSH